MKNPTKTKKHCKNYGTAALLCILLAFAACGSSDSSTGEPADPSLTYSTLSANPATLPAGGTSTITLQIKDAEDNPITTGGLTVTMTTIDSGGMENTLTVTDNNDGTYTAAVTSTVVETTTITASIGGSSVTDTLTITFTRSVSLSQSTLSVDKPSLPYQHAATVTLQARDGSGNAITADGLTVTMRATPRQTPTGIVTFSTVTSLGNGTYTATMTTPLISGVIGRVTITAAITGLGDVENTVDFIFTAEPNGPFSTLSVNPSSVPKGTPAIISLHLRDVAMNPIIIPNVGYTIAISTTPVSNTVNIGPLQNQGDGRYTATVTNTAIETLTFTAAAGAFLLAGQLTADIAFTAGSLSLGASTLNANPARDVPVSGNGGSSTVTLQAKDSDGDNITSGGLTVTMAANPSADVNVGTVTDLGDGTYTAVVERTTPGNANITASIAGMGNVADTVTITFIDSSVASAAHSTLSVSPSGTIPPRSTVTVTLQAKDSSSINLSNGGHTVTMTATDSSNTVVTLPVTDLGDGTYTAPLRSNTRETFTVAAAINGNALTTDTLSITFDFPAGTITGLGNDSDNAYRELTSPTTSKIWLDRNLGAWRPCEDDDTDEERAMCYGGLYQWGAPYRRPPA